MQKLENLNTVLNFFQNEGLVFLNIGAEDIIGCSQKLILGLIWMIILHYQIQKGQKGNEKTSARSELLEWVRNMVPD